MLSNKAQKIREKVVFKAVPMIHDECERLGIPYPKIEWISSITTEEEEIGGVYQYETQKILLNLGIIDGMLEKDMPESNVIRGMLFLFFHEFKHYIDHKAHKVSLQEFRLGRGHYEFQANVYAEELYKKV